MPAAAAHYYFGQEVLKLLPEELQSIIGKNKAAYDFGLQGPDFLFYYRPFKTNRVSNMGHRIHREPAEAFIENALKVLRGKSDRKMQAYLMGFVCHFILDSSLHGIISQTAPKTPDHNRLEAELDRQIIEEHYDLEAEKFKRHSLLKMDTRNFKWMEAFYPELSEHILKKSAKGYYFYSKLLNSKPDIKKNVIIAIEKLYYGEKRFSSLMIDKEKNGKLYAAARELYVQMDKLATTGAEAVENVYSCISGKGTLSRIFERNFK
ncbi:MAG: zinc dependent phospholipase C family protein [Clostridiaceae bacterium]